MSLTSELKLEIQYYVHVFQLANSVINIVYFSAEREREQHIACNIISIFVQFIRGSFK